jgi:hypothetical protein
MQSFRRITALFLLLCWLLAAGHVVAEHGCDVSKPSQHSLVGYDATGAHGYDLGTGHGRETHSHDVTTTATRSGNYSRLIAPVSPRLPFLDAFAERFVASLRLLSDSFADVAPGKTPEDERSSGWLLVCQTALPVRGPSLSAC